MGIASVETGGVREVDIVSELAEGRGAGWIWGDPADGIPADQPGGAGRAASAAGPGRAQVERCGGPRLVVARYRNLGGQHPGTRGLRRTTPRSEGPAGGQALRDRRRPP